MSLTPERYERAREVFLEARALSGAARAHHLDRECRGDSALRAEVESLLATDAPTEDPFLSEPPLGSALQLRVASPDAGMPAEPVVAGDPDPIPERIGRYRLLQQIGEGGFGSVFMAEQESPVRRRVALKVIKAGMDTKQVIARFEAERQALAMMDHPNIAKVLDAGATATGRPYFVMELVKGVPITEFCDTAGLRLRDRLHLFTQVCHAVQHAHQKGVIHRDIKPSNVMITSHDGKPIPKVIDFGIAKATNQRLTENTLFTRYGQFIGTPEYMSPEQAEMSALDIDTRTDIYSLGVLLYELLTGTTPFDRATLHRAALSEVQRMIRDLEPPRPSTRLSSMGAAAVPIARARGSSAPNLSRSLRGELDWIILKSLEKDRTRRYETANGFAADIDRFLSDEPVDAGPPRASYRVRKFIKRHRVAATVVGTVAAALVLGMIGTSVGMVWALRERERAEGAQASAERAQLTAESARAGLAEANAALAGQRDEAEHQARLARSVLDYITGDLIAAVHPHQLGRDATLVEWLESASGSLRREVTPFVDAPEALIALNHAIGSAFLELSRFEQAREHLARAYHGAVVLHGPHSAQTLRIAATYGRSLFEFRWVEDAAEVLENSLIAAEAHHPDDIAMRVDLMNALVDTLDFLTIYMRSSEACESALRLAREAVKLSDRTGDGKRLVASLNRLAKIENTAHGPSASLPITERAMLAAAATYGSVHAESIRAKRQLAMALAAAETRREEAMSLLREAAAATTEVFGTDSRMYFMIQHEVAMQFEAEGRWHEAHAAYLEAASHRARVLGPDATWTLGMRLEAGRALWELGRRDEAYDLCKNVLRSSLEAHGPGSGFTAHTARHLARLYQRGQKEDEAVESWRLAVAACNRASPGSGVAAEFAVEFASFLEDLGQCRAAVEVLHDVLGDDTSVLGQRADLRSAARMMVGLLKACGDVLEAERWRDAIE